MYILKCSKCKKNKNSNEFHQSRKDKNTYREGLHYYCVQCRSKRNRIKDKTAYGKKKRYTACLLCRIPRKLNKNNKCRKCNLQYYLKECIKCKDLLSTILFFKNKFICKHCY